MDVIDLGAAVIPEVLNRAGVKSAEIDLVTWGHTRPTGYEGDTARLVALQAGIPIQVPAFTINMACISAMQAVISGIQAILLGEAHVVLAGGMESMSTGSYILKGARWGFRSGSKTVIDELYVPPRACAFPMGGTAENVAERYGISREEQDQYAYTSQLKAVNAQDNGWFDEEIISVMVPQPKDSRVQFSKDECIRRDVSIEKLAGLPPVFREKGTVTAGNSCPLADGASALVLASRKKADELGRKPLLSFLSYHQSAVDPAYMGIGPIVAVPKALEKAGLRLQDINLVEHNEAFASVVLACMRELEYDPARLNIHGGAIALGHPTGSTGARLIVTLYYSLKRVHGEIGLATLCGGTGVTGAMLVKLEN
jgi:acetyl-CoA C-acetyltransferase